MTNFNRQTTRLLETAKNGRIGIRNFEKLFPEITRQLRTDAGASYLKWWGQSLNIDEFEQALIVDPKILNVIGRLARCSIRDGNYYHAGLVHTYGYLLSQLQTRYGYKRERWTSGVIESGFGFDRGVLSANPPEGTLLKNASFVLMNLTSNSTRSFGEADLEDVPNGLQTFRYGKISFTRFKEVVKIKHQRQPSVAELYTDIAKYKCKQQTSNALLVYSYQLKKTGGNRSTEPRQLVTCFPINEAMKRSLIEDIKSGNKTVRPRYNLVLDGLPKDGVKGKRAILA